MRWWLVLVGLMMLGAQHPNCEGKFEGERRCVGSVLFLFADGEWSWYEDCSLSDLDCQDQIGGYGECR